MSKPKFQFHKRQICLTLPHINSTPETDLNIGCKQLFIKKKKKKRLVGFARLWCNISYYSCSLSQPNLRMSNNRQMRPKLDTHLKCCWSSLPALPSCKDIIRSIPPGTLTGETAAIMPNIIAHFQQEHIIPTGTNGKTGNQSGLICGRHEVSKNNKKKNCNSQLWQPERCRDAKRGADYTTKSEILSLVSC